MVSPQPNATTGLYEFSIIVEKLEGACLRCAGQSTEPEVVILQLAGGLENYQYLSFWSTNETHQFIQQPDLVVSTSGQVSFEAQPDSIYTISSLIGQSKGSFDMPIPPSAPFPFPYADDFDSYSVDAEAAYFADDGGSFLIAAAPAGEDERGMVLQQFVINQAGVNAWVPDTPPITVLFVHDLLLL
jgi:galactosylceramidase